jgi:methyltransferase-like protein
VLHEHLEVLNHPIYFHEFAARLAEQELKVLADSRVWSMAMSAQPNVSAVLDRLSRDPIGREQYHDFLCNRRFRRSIICHANCEVPGPSMDRIKKVRASAAVWPTTSPADFASKASVDFRGGDGVIRLSTIDPIFKVALLSLAEAYPRSLTFDELWSLSRTRLARAGVEVADDPNLLAGRMLQAFGANALELHTFEPPIPTAISDKPKALATARQIAEAGGGMPNYRHRLTALSDFDRLVLCQLDGDRTHAEIVDRLVEAVVAGKFAIQQNAIPMKDPAQIRPILERSLPPSLERLNRGALLVR